MVDSSTAPGVDWQKSSALPRSARSGGTAARPCRIAVPANGGACRRSHLHLRAFLFIHRATRRLQLQEGADAGFALELRPAKRLSQLEKGATATSTLRSEPIGASCRRHSRRPQPAAAAAVRSHPAYRPFTPTPGQPADMADIEQELTAYAERRAGGRSTQAALLVANAAQAYRAAVRVLQRHGAGSNKFWRSLEVS